MPLRKKRIKEIIILVSVLTLVSFAHISKPTVYIIGDSTVRNTNKEQWGWGTLIADYFDTSRITIANHAMAGRSTRTFTREGRFRVVDSLMKEGDYLLIQFGHNDGQRPDTTAKNRGVLKGTGEDSVTLTYANGKIETVHSYGWYLRMFVRTAKSKGVTPVICSLIPRNIWKDNKVVRSRNDFAQWAKEVAEQEHIAFIDLNSITADKYDRMGQEQVNTLFGGDHTHTNKPGADMNAQSVVEGIKANINLSLNKYLKK